MPVIDDLLAALAHDDDADKKALEHNRMLKLQALADQAVHPEVGPRILADTMLSPNAQKYLDQVMAKKQAAPSADPLGGGIYMQEPRSNSSLGPVPAVLPQPPPQPALDRTGYPPHMLNIPESAPTIPGTLQRRLGIILNRLKDRLDPNRYESFSTDANKHDQGGE